VKAVTVGLTGGIGAGKSTVADMLVAKGAVLIDADSIAREVVAPGGPAYGPLVDRFGESILAEDRSIDRKALAGIAFADPEALADLNAATHPAIGKILAERRAAAEADHKVIVLDIPLMKATHRDQLAFDVVVVVDAPVEVAIGRLVDNRGFDRADAQARVQNQISREQRRALADVVLDNGGGMDELTRQVDNLWADLAARSDGPS
jgi:dephospho-CoA kinase